MRTALLVAFGALALTLLAKVSEAQSAKLKPVVLTEEKAKWDKKMRIGTAKVTLAKGQGLIVRLESNPTTGYAWKITQQQKKEIRLLRKDYLAPNSTLLGSGGTDVFSFQALKEGSSTLQLKYARPFDKSPKDFTQLTIVVTVTEKATQ